MADRPTHEIELPSGKRAALKDYLTARERNELRRVFLTGETPRPKISDLKGELLDAAERKLLELAVVSYDGNADNAVERILDGSPEDYDRIVADANKLGFFKPAK
jgi:hypothetical protein